MKPLNLRIEEVDIDDIYPDPKNINKHTEESIQALREILREYGQQHPLVVDESGCIYVGNGRWRAMKLEGWTRVVVNYSNLPIEKLKEFALADNISNKNSNIDDTRLGNYLKLLHEKNSNFKFEKLGFTPEKINKIKEGFKMPTFDASTIMNPDKASINVEEAKPSAKQIELDGSEEFTPIETEKSDRRFNREDRPKSDYIKLETEDQRAIINQAISLIRANEANYKLPEAACLELICLEFISSHQNEQ